MPRFFFNVIGNHADVDEIGTDLPSIGYAKREGVKLLGALIAEGLLAHHDGVVRLEVTDETGALLFHVDVASGGASDRLAA